MAKVTVKGLLEEIRDILKSRMPIPVAREERPLQVSESINLTQLLSSPNRFEKLSDGWIKDKLLGIEWGPSSDRTMKFADAQEHCAKLGARLPSRLELVSIQDITKYKPAVLALFTDTKTDDWYWSGDICAFDSSYAWVVNFYSGNVNYGGTGYNNYVRPVRSNQ